MIEKVYAERAIITKFLAVGILGFLANYIILRVVSSDLKLDRVVSEILAAAVALQITFALNNIWTYRVNDGHTSLRLRLRDRYAAYLATNSFGSLMTVALFALFSIVMGRLVALAGAAILAMLWNYTMNKVFIWRKSLALQKTD